MANYAFDFNKIKRSFFTVTLKNGKKVVVKMPQKKTFEKMQSLSDIDTENITVEDAFDTIGGLVAEILNNNMDRNLKFTAKDISDDYDIEEMKEFIKQYEEYVKGATSNPN